MKKANKKSFLKSCSLLFILIALCFSLAPAPSWAGEPLQILKTYSQKVIDILQDPQYADQKITENQLDKLRKLGRKIFSFEQLSMRTLGRNWPKLSKKQQEEFIDLFPKLLEKNYLGKIHEYKQESVEFTQETIFSSRKAEVKSLIKTQSKQVPVDYRLVKINGEWKIYDVLVEGVSLVQNYRSQFSEILMNNSPQEMLQILREKVNTEDKG